MTPDKLQLDGGSSAEVKISCCVCQKQVDWNTAVKDGWTADRDGKPFESYHCPECLTKVCWCLAAEGMYASRGNGQDNE